MKSHDIRKKKFTDFFPWFSGQFFAHTHKDDYRLHSFSSNISFSQHDPLMSFLLLAPAISPVYHNNPAFRILSLDVEKLSLIDFTQYFMDLVMATGN